MRGAGSIRIPDALRPLLDRPVDWPSDLAASGGASARSETHVAGGAWRVAAAAYRASGLVMWASRVEPPDAEAYWLEGYDDSRPAIVQSECVPALIAALETTPPGAAVEVIAPTSLRYLVEGRSFGVGAPEHRLADLAAARRIWARYALDDLEEMTNACLARAAALLSRVRWPAGGGLVDTEYVLYTDGGCTPHACAAAWVLCRGPTAIGEHAWTVERALVRDGVRLAEFSAAVDGLSAVPHGASVAVVSDHADLSDFGVRLVPAFRPGPAVADVLESLRSLTAERQVRWFWAARDETAGQRRCQALIDRQVRAAPAFSRFLATCRAAGLQRVFVPDFERWFAPREPLVNEGHAQWSATFERRDRFLAADVHSPRLFLRQVRLPIRAGSDLMDSFSASEAGGWCVSLVRCPPLAGAESMVRGRLRSGLELVALLYKPDVALLIQTRPGATLEDALDAARTCHHQTLGR